MSHEGNDKIIDNERDNPEIKMDDIRAALIQKMVFAATEVGIAVVQEIAEEALKRKPGLSLKEFTKVLDKYIEEQKNRANSNG